MPSRPVLIGRGLVPQPLNQDNNHNDGVASRVLASTNPEHIHQGAHVPHGDEGRTATGE